MRGSRIVGHVLRRNKSRPDCKSDKPYPYFSAPADICSNFGRYNMLHYAVVFFVIALIAAFFGFGGIAVGAAGIAKILFIVFMIGAVITFLMSLGRRA